MSRVSVIIPCYNHAHYLPDALNSVLAQTYTDWEAIIVDDGSTDNTRAVAAQFIDPRIHYLHQENQGLSAARNAGIRAAQGEFIALLDADDMWEPTFLEKMVTVLQAEPTASAAYCGFRYMNANAKLLNQSVMKVVPPEAFRDELLHHGSWLNPCSVIVHASAYREVGPFDETLRACEDLDIWLRLSEQHRFIGVPEVLVRYRRTGNNMSDDVERMSKAKRQVFEKHIGKFDPQVDIWTVEKRQAACQIYSMETQEYLAQQNVTASARAFLGLYQYCSAIAVSLDLWYSLACVHQLKGTRGDFDTWQPTRSEADLRMILSELQESTISASQQRRFRSTADLALSLLYYGQGNDRMARRKFLSALLAWTGWMRRRRTWSLFVRLMPGVGALKRYGAA